MQRAIPPTATLPARHLVAGCAPTAARNSEVAAPPDPGDTVLTGRPDRGDTAAEPVRDHLPDASLRHDLSRRQTEGGAAEQDRGGGELWSCGERDQAGTRAEEGDGQDQAYEVNR